MHILSDFYFYRTGDIALIGLAVMGQNIILNMADHGFTVVAFNRTVDKVDAFINTTAKGKSIIGATSLEDMVSKLKFPRRIMLLVKGLNMHDFLVQIKIFKISKRIIYIVTTLKLLVYQKII